VLGNRTRWAPGGSVQQTTWMRDGLTPGSKLRGAGVWNAGGSGATAVAEVSEVEAASETGMDDDAADAKDDDDSEKVRARSELVIRDAGTASLAVSTSLEEDDDTGTFLRKPPADGGGAAASRGVAVAVQYRPSNAARARAAQRIMPTESIASSNVKAWATSNRGGTAWLCGAPPDPAPAGGAASAGVPPGPRPR
jgi:hypothetical protein